MKKDLYQPGPDTLCHGRITPLGEIWMESDGSCLTALYFWDDPAKPRPGEAGASACPVFGQADAWLDLFFAGQDPGPTPPLAPGGTEFARQVWHIMNEIPRGRLAGYGEIARRLEEKTGKRTSARAVGGAVGRNPILLMQPCHRVVGKNGALTGFSAGIQRKEALLKLEQADRETLYHF